MRALVQRVSSASVSLPGGERRGIGRGLLVYLGVGKGDTPDMCRKLADKVAELRIFSNAAGKFDRSLLDAGGEALVVSQFTLYGNPWEGRRPDFTAAERPEAAVGLYDVFVDALRSRVPRVKTGEFAAHMNIESVNDGPVTLLLDLPAQRP